MTLVESGGFAEAQIALNLSTSTLSTHLATLERKLGILRRHCADAGRDPAEIEVSTGVRGGAGPKPSEVGPRLREIGASLFTIGVGGPDPDLSGLRDWIDWRETTR